MGGVDQATGLIHIASPLFGSSHINPNKTDFENQMAFLTFLFKQDLPKDPFEREAMINGQFEQFFRAADYAKILPACPWGMHTRLPAMDMELAGGMRSLIDAYVNLKIGIVFPGTSLNDFLSTPHWIANMMRDVAKSEEGKATVAQHNAKAELDKLGRAASNLAQTK